MEEARNANKQGAVLCKEVEAALHDVETNAAKSGKLMQTIHGASQQMLLNMQHISTGSHSMETVTQKNAAIADDNMTTSSTLAQETEQFQQTLTSLEESLLGSRS